MLTILEGSTFCICDDRGDIRAGTSGLFAADTRFLSRLELMVEDAPPLLLSSGKVEYFSAAFFLRNNVSSRLAADVISIDRRRFVGPGGIADTLLLRNEGMDHAEFRLAIVVEADFADIFTVKDHDFALGHPSTAPDLPPSCVLQVETDRQLVFGDDATGARTQILLSQPCSLFDGHAIAYEITLAPGESWELRLDVAAYPEGDLEDPPLVEARFGTELEHIRESLDAWHV